MPRPAWPPGRWTVRTRRSVPRPTYRPVPSSPCSPTRSPSADLARPLGAPHQASTLLTRQVCLANQASAWLTRQTPGRMVDVGGGWEGEGVAYDEVLAARIRTAIQDVPGVTEKKMFGGLAFLLNGNMAVAASGQGGLLLRVDPDETATLVREDGVDRFEMRGKAMDGWAR